MIIDGEIWVSQSEWDRIPQDAQEIMQKVSTVRIFSDAEWAELGRQLKVVAVQMMMK